MVDREFAKIFKGIVFYRHTYMVFISTPVNSMMKFSSMIKEDINSLKK